MESYPHLEAPPVRNIRDFLMASLKFMNPQPNRELVESYCKLYNRARHDPGVRKKKLLIGLYSSRPIRMSII